MSEGLFTEDSKHLGKKESLKAGKHDSERHLYFCTTSTVTNFIFKLECSGGCGAGPVGEARPAPCCTWPAPALQPGGEQGLAEPLSQGGAASRKAHLRKSRNRGSTDITRRRRSMAPEQVFPEASEVSVLEQGKSVRKR